MARRVSFLIIVIGFLCISICKGDNKNVEYTYIPEDIVGDFKVSVNPLRMVDVNWKDIPLFTNWGEIYGKPPKTSWPDNTPGVGPIRGVYHVPRDIMVKVEKDKGKITYTWEYSDFFIGYRQINKVAITPNHVSADTILKFTKYVPQEIIFQPAIFPGKPKGWGRSRESMILGKEFLITRKDGATYTKIYPDMKEGFNWLEDDTRGLNFSLHDGAVSFVFSSSAPEMKLSFVGNAYLPDSSRDKRRGIIGLLRIHPKKNEVVNIHADIFLNDSTPEVMIAPFDELDNLISLDAVPSHPSKIYLPEDKIQYSIGLDNRWTKRKRDIMLSYEVVNYYNDVVYKAANPLSVNSETKAEIPLELPVKQTGIFNFIVTSSEGSKVIGKKVVSFARILPPVDIPAEESFFGCDGGMPSRALSEWGYRESERKNIDCLYRALYLLGIKEIRSTPPKLSWEEVEPQPNHYCFSPGLDELVDIILKNKMEIRVTDVFTHHIPPWAWQDGRTFPWIGPSLWDKPRRAPKVPHDEKEWALYENYMYQVAKHFKGKIKYYELANEPSSHHAWDSVYNEYAMAFSKGIRKADPAAKVIDCALSHISIQELKSYLEYQDACKYIDIIAPHYFFGIKGIKKPGATIGSSGDMILGIDYDSTPVEDVTYMNKIKSLVELAKKYNLEIWNGEDGRWSPWEGGFPLGHFFDWQKEYVNLSVRSNLLLKSFPEIKKNSLCFALSFPNGAFYDSWIAGNDGAEYCAQAFWVVEGNITPWATAHSALSRLIDGSEFKERLQFGTKDLYCFRFSRGRENVAAVWMKKGKAAWEISLPKGVQYINVVGNAKNLKGENTLVVSGEPFYLYGNNMDEMEFAKVLKSGHLIPENPIVIDKIEFSKDLSAINVFIRNFALEDIILDRVTVLCEGYRQTLEKVKLTPNRVTSIAFELKEQVTDNLIVQVKATWAGKMFKKEDFLIYPSASCAQKQGLLVAKKAKRAVKIDGNLSEWDDAVPMVIDKKVQVGSIEKNKLWNGPEDLSGTGYVMWDDNYFYFACKVMDDIYSNPFEGKEATWCGDSIQIALDPLMDNCLETTGEGYNADDREINIAYSKGRSVVYGRKLGEKTEELHGAQGVVLPRGKGLVYELSVPIKEVLPFKPEHGEWIRFNFIINDDDGKGRKWIGLSEGIGESKSPSLYKKMLFVDK